MHVQVLKECGYDEALLGLSLSYNKQAHEMPQVAEMLCQKGDEEGKFLRRIRKEEGCRDLKDLFTV